MASAKVKAVPSANEKLLEACSSGDASKIDKLLKEKGAEVSVNFSREPDGRTGLMFAASRGKADMVKILLEAGASVNQKSKLGKTSLMFAAANGYEEVVSLLLDAKADPTIKDKRDMTAADFAKTSKQAKKLGKLLEAAGSSRSSSPSRSDSARSDSRATKLRSPSAADELMSTVHFGFVAPNGGGVGAQASKPLHRRIKSSVPTVSGLSQKRLSAFSPAVPKPQTPAEAAAESAARAASLNTLWQSYGRYKALQAEAAQLTTQAERLLLAAMPELAAVNAASAPAPATATADPAAATAAGTTPTVAPTTGDAAEVKVPEATSSATGTPADAPPAAEAPPAGGGGGDEAKTALPVSAPPSQPSAEGSAAAAAGPSDLSSEASVQQALSLFRRGFLSAGGALQEYGWFIRALHAQCGPQGVDAGKHLKTLLPTLEQWTAGSNSQYGGSSNVIPEGGEDNQGGDEEEEDDQLSARSVKSKASSTSSSTAAAAAAAAKKSRRGSAEQTSSSSSSSKTTPAKPASAPRSKAHDDSRVVSRSSDNKQEKHSAGSSGRNKREEEEEADEDSGTKSGAFSSPVEEFMESQLEQVVGLELVKDQIRRFYKKVQLDQIRRLHQPPVPGSSEPEPLYHMVFRGPPGVGKTMMAKLIAQLMRKMQLVKSDAFVHVPNPLMLLGEHIGSTAPKVTAKILEAKDGVMLIDEAYSIIDNKFGREAIDIMMQHMYSPCTCVFIFAGYSEPMERFLSANEGIKRRCPYRFDFTPYTPKQLVQIFQVMATYRYHQILDFSCENPPTDTAGAGANTAPAASGATAAATTADAKVGEGGAGGEKSKAVGADHSSHEHAAEEKESKEKETEEEAARKRQEMLRLRRGRLTSRAYCAPSSNNEINVGGVQVPVPTRREALELLRQGDIFLKYPYHEGFFGNNKSSPKLLFYSASGPDDDGPPSSRSKLRTGSPDVSDSLLSGAPQRSLSPPTVGGGSGGSGSGEGDGNARALRSLTLPGGAAAIPPSPAVSARNDAADEGAIYYCNPGFRTRSANKCISIKDLAAVYLGKQTPAFQRRAASTAMEDHCFSLISPQRTLELEAASIQKRNQWIAAIFRLVSSAQRGLVIRRNVQATTGAGGRLLRAASELDGGGGSGDVSAGGGKDRAYSVSVSISELPRGSGTLSPLEVAEITRPRSFTEGSQSDGGGGGDLSSLTPASPTAAAGGGDAPPTGTEVTTTTATATATAPEEEESIETVLLKVFEQIPAEQLHSQNAGIVETLLQFAQEERDTRLDLDEAARDPTLACTLTMDDIQRAIPLVLNAK